MDELEIKGKKYISSKRASELTGYAKDYVGQLARGGKITATRVGRSWYVEEGALLSHKRAEPSLVLGNGSPKTPESKSTTPRAPQTIPLSALRSLGFEAKMLPDTWTAVRYLPDDSALFPTPHALAESEEVIFTPEPLRAAERIRALREKVEIGRKEIKRATPPSRSPRERRRKKIKNRAILSLGALTAALGFFLFFASGFFLSSQIRLESATTAETASILAGFEYIEDVFGQYPFIEQGLASLIGFLTLVFKSFWDFLASGFDFLVYLMGLLFVP